MKWEVEKGIASLVIVIPQQESYGVCVWVWRTYCIVVLCMYAYGGTVRNTASVVQYVLVKKCWQSFKL